MIWFDAHPDITIPEDIEDGRGFSEMPVSHIMGLKGCDPEILKWERKFKPSNFFHVGLRVLNEIQTKRIKELNLQNISCEEFRTNPKKLEELIKQTKCSKFVVHLDLDVLDPEDLYCAVAHDPNGMSVKEIIEAMNGISKNSEIVAFTIAEAMPQVQMRMKNMFKEFSIFK